MKHGVGLINGLGLIQYLAVDVYNCIRSNKNVFTNGFMVVHGLVFGEELTNFFGRQCGWKILIGLDGDIIELKTCIPEELMSAW